MSTFKQLSDWHSAGWRSCPKRWCTLVHAHRQDGSGKDSGAMRLEPVGDTLVQGGGQALSDWAQWIHVVWHHSDYTPPPHSVRRLPAWGGDAKAALSCGTCTGSPQKRVFDNALVHLRRQYTQGDKNQYTTWFLVWLLCALVSTPLWRIDVLFLNVGHTQQVG